MLVAIEGLSHCGQEGYVSPQGSIVPHLNVSASALTSFACPAGPLCVCDRHLWNVSAGAIRPRHAGGKRGFFDNSYPGHACLFRGADLRLLLAQDCNLVMYDKNSLTSGRNAATAVFASNTFGAGTNCFLSVSGANGGSFSVITGAGKTVFSRP